MPKKPAALKAIVIDDAYALPTPATLTCPHRPYQ